jgi:hypothetical protein
MVRNTPMPGGMQCLASLNPADFAILINADDLSMAKQDRK